MTKQEELKILESALFIYAIFKSILPGLEIGPQLQLGNKINSIGSHCSLSATWYTVSDLLEEVNNNYIEIILKINALLNSNLILIGLL